MSFSATKTSIIAVHHANILLKSKRLARLSKKKPNRCPKYLSLGIINESVLLIEPEIGWSCFLNRGANHSGRHLVTRSHLVHVPLRPASIRDERCEADVSQDSVILDGVSVFSLNFLGRDAFITIFFRGCALGMHFDLSLASAEILT